MKRKVVNNETESLEMMFHAIHFLGGKCTTHKDLDLGNIMEKVRHTIS